MPSSCSEGACGTCKSVLVSGEVEMKHAGGIRAQGDRGRKVPALLFDSLDRSRRREVSESVAQCLSFVSLRP